MASLPRRVHRTSSQLLHLTHSLPGPSPFPTLPYFLPASLPFCSCADESIDEIAAFLGVGEQVAELTKQ